MLEQKGWHLRIEDFTSDLVKFADLVYYDGPLLSHYTTRSRSKHYLFHWIDNDAERNRWLVMEVTLAHLFDYISDTRTLFDITQQEYNNKLLVVDTDPNGTFTFGLLVSVTELNPDYVPEKESYFEAVNVLASMPNYVALFQDSRRSVMHAEYLEEMRSKAVRFRLEPVGEGYGTTLGANDIGSFLQRITRSFRSYLEVCLPNLFSSRFVAEEMEKVLNKLLESSGDPRAVFANHGSFEIELAVDVLHLLGVDSDIVTWQRQALQEYKRDVFDYDFANAEQPPINLANASPDQLRAIYQPIVLIANSSNYNVKARSTVVEDYKVLKRISPQNARKVAPPKQKGITEEQLDTELTNVLFELQRGQDPRTLTLSQLRRAVVAVTSGDESLTPISEFISSEGELITLREPIEIALSRVGDYYEARYEALDIDKLGASARAALDAVEDELRRIYSQAQQRSENPNDPIGEKQGRRLSAFSDLLGT